MTRSTDWRAGGTSLRRSTEGAGSSPASRRTSETPATHLVPELPDFDPDDIDPEELRDFMSADWVEVEADPGFRERLRSRLWKMLRASHADDDVDEG